MKRCTITIKPKTLLMIVQSLHLILFCVQKLILYHFLVIFSRKRFFCDDIVHFNDKENLVTYVDFLCGITFYPEASTKVKQFNRERKNFCRSCEKPKCITSNDQHNCSIDEELTSNGFLNPYNLWDMDPALLSHSTTITTWTLCPTGTLKQQLTNLEQTYIQCCLHYERWTVKGKDWASALNSFRKLTYRTEE